jgi:hypothetical protein
MLIGIILSLFQNLSYVFGNLSKEVGSYCRFSKFLPTPNPSFGKLSLAATFVSSKAPSKDLRMFFEQSLGTSNYLYTPNLISPLSQESGLCF